MIQFFNSEDLVKAKKQKTKTLLIYSVVLLVYLVFAVGLFLWFRTLPYQSKMITTVKLILYPLTSLMIIFTFIYMGICFKRVNKYVKKLNEIVEGRKETFTGSFIEYSETLQQKDGVDFKCLIFLEWNKYKKDFFERKVLVLANAEFPKFKENMNVKYVTQGNVLFSYEILDLDLSNDN